MLIILARKFKLCTLNPGLVDGLSNEARLWVGTKAWFSSFGSLRNSGGILIILIEGDLLNTFSHLHCWYDTETLHCFRKLRLCQKVSIVRKFCVYTDRLLPRDAINLENLNFCPKFQFSEKLTLWILIFMPNVYDLLWF